jgi:nucleoid DNA-binding protein
MTKPQLARAAAREFYLSLAEAGRLVDFLFSEITGSLRKDERVYLKDFGIFIKKTRPGRHVRHPRTGKLIWIPPRTDVDFNPAKGLLKAKRR